MALLCTKWKSQNKQEQRQIIKVEEQQLGEDNEIPYQPFEDADFDKVLEQVSEIRKVNINKDLNDDERRKNAESAILMLSKYLNIDEGDEDESD
jgi:hypothetical protein